MRRFSTLVSVSLITASAALFAAAAENAPAPPDAPAVIAHQITLDGANTVLAAAIAEARRVNAGGAIAVVDSGGDLVAFQRLDGTFAAGSEVSIGKARTAAKFKKPTRAFEESINKGRTALLGVEQLTPLIGGVPITHDGFVIGAIGVSGAHSQDEDEQIAIAGAAAVASPASH